MIFKMMYVFYLHRVRLLIQLFYDIHLLLIINSNPAISSISWRDGSVQIILAISSFSHWADQMLKFGHPGLTFS